MNLPSDNLLSLTTSHGNRLPTANQTTARNMFLDRPYVKCIKCMNATHIKCEECLKLMVQKLRQLHSKEEEEKAKMRRLTEKKRKVPREQQVLQISNHYSMFLQRKLSEPGLSTDRFTKPMRYGISPIRQARFETWTKKSYDKIKQALLLRLSGMQKEPPR